ncbi:MAG: hypothetical protein HOP19_16220 [Acidobacteria bacterium]|nr:hypothetical protein [Acidobacteriota bacterium]
MMQQQIEVTLRVLIGLPLWGVSRALNLESFQFGLEHTAPIRRGGTKTVGDYALHVQCAWRIRSSSRIIVASDDRYSPADETLTEDDNFEWDVPGANRCDRRMDEWLAAFAGNYPVVTNVATDSVGGFSLFLSDDQMLEVFPDNSLTDEYSEYWRFFKHSSDDKHFVFSGTGFSLE